MYARRRPGIVLSDSLTEIGDLEQVVAHHRPKAIACISEEVLGIGRKLLAASYRSGEPSPCPSPIGIRARKRQAIAAVE